MRYEHTPRPAIEDHHHIRELIERQEARTADRIYHQVKDKNLSERMSDIKAEQWKAVKDFWCPTCEVDFLSEGIKEVEIDWSNPAQYIAFYRTKCSKGHWCQRLITDRLKDIYFYRSRRVARDRAVHFGDTLQPWQTGFNLMYGRKNKS